MNTDPRWTVMHRPIIHADESLIGILCGRCDDYMSRHAPWWRRLLRRIGNRVMP